MQLKIGKKHNKIVTMRYETWLLYKKYPWLKPKMTVLPVDTKILSKLGDTLLKFAAKQYAGGVKKLAAEASSPENGFDRPVDFQYLYKMRKVSELQLYPRLQVYAFLLQLMGISIEDVLVVRTYDQLMEHLNQKAQAEGHEEYVPMYPRKTTFRQMREIKRKKRLKQK